MIKKIIFTLLFFLGFSQIAPLQATTESGPGLFPINEGIGSKNSRQIDLNLPDSVSTGISNFRADRSRYAMAPRSANRDGKKFTPAGKKVVKDANAAANGGQMKCANGQCGKDVQHAKQSKKDVTPPDDEAHVDHIKPMSKGGAGSPENGQVLCRTCNLKKSDH